MLEQGRLLVQQGDAGRQLPACVQCHGPAMTGLNPAIPGLPGLPRDYLNSQLGAWKTGQRREAGVRLHGRHCAPVMNAYEEVSAVSAWLAAQSVPERLHPAGGGHARALRRGGCGAGVADAAAR